MRTKGINLGAAMWLLLLPATFLTSCTKDDDAANNTAVTLTFTTRAPGDGTDPNLLPGEGMKHLRIIVEEDQSSIRYNYTHTFTSEETSHTVKFGDLYAGKTYHFYAVANESSFDGKFDGISPEVVIRLQKTALTADPNSLIGQGKSLPASGTLTLEQLNGITSLKKNISLKRVVAKVNLTIKNETGNSQTLNDVKIADASAEKTPLLEGTSIPVGTKKEVSWGTIDVPAKGYNAVRYLYESSQTSGFQLTAIWNGKMYELPLVTSGKPITEIPRNTQLNLTVTLKENAAQPCTLVCELAPWTEKELTPEYQ